MIFVLFLYWLTWQDMEGWLHGAVPFGVPLPISWNLSVCVIFSTMWMLLSRLLLRHIPMSSRSPEMSISPSGSFNIEWVETFLITLYFFPICSCFLRSRCSFCSSRQDRNFFKINIVYYYSIRTHFYPVQPSDVVIMSSDKMSYNFDDFSVQIRVFTENVFSSWM